MEEKSSCSVAEASTSGTQAIPAQSLIPMVSKELQPQLEATLNLTLQTMQSEFNYINGGGGYCPRCQG